jgi:hypothetical protein
MKFVTFRKSQMIRAGVLEGDGAGDRDSVIDLMHPAMRGALGDVEPHLETMLEAGLAETIRRINAHGGGTAAVRRGYPDGPAAAAPHLRDRA